MALGCFCVALSYLKALWDLDRFEDFIVARKKLLLEHFRALKVLPAQNILAVGIPSAEACDLPSV
jgi:hypothetical protein